MLGRQLGKELALHNAKIIYGGNRFGIMGAVADGCLEAGGDVIGIMPENRIGLELAHKNLTKLIPVETMHGIKYLMAELADIFLVIPGGFCTIDEAFKTIA